MHIFTKTYRPVFLLFALVNLGPQFAQAQKVGINTTTPVFILDVRGLNPDDGGLLQIANSDETQRLLLFGGREGDPNPFMQWKEGSPMRFVTDEGGFRELMRIGSDGNVGIGTSTAEALLHIRGISAKMQIESMDNTDPELSLSSLTGGTAYLHKFNTGRLLLASGGAFNMGFLNSFGGSFNFEEGSSTRLRIAPGGNVGVGILAPTEKLHVAGNIRVQNDASIFGLDQLVGFNDLKLAGDAVGGTDLFISPGGNIGIGTVSPSEKLHVAGNIRVQNGASIFGLDQLVGFNDLRFSGDAAGGTDMIINTNGRIGINTGVAANSLLLINSKPDDDYIMVLRDNNNVNRFLFGKTGYVGINQVFTNVTFNVRGAVANQRIFNVVNSAGNTSFFNVEGNGAVNVTGTLSKGGGSFKIDHPLDPENKYLYHSFVESPDMMNVYNGNITTNSNGEAVVTMPDWFEALNKDFRYQLTTIGQPAQAWVQDELSDHTFTLKTDKPNVKVSWLITGIRKDAWAEKNRIPVEEKKGAEERGKYQHPESFGKPATMSVGYKEEMTKGNIQNQ